MIWTGEQLFRIWTDSCGYSSKFYQKDWNKLYPHDRDKWNELAATIAGEPTMSDEIHVDCMEQALGSHGQG